MFAEFGTDSELLFNINTQTQQPQVVESGRGIFGDRISAIINNGKTYQLKLENLNYNDSVTFKLDAQTRNNRVSSAIDIGEIKLTVKGREYFSICSLAAANVRKIYYIFL